MRVSVQYVDHNLLQTDEKAADDHAFLASACGKYGILVPPDPNRARDAKLRKGPHIGSLPEFSGLPDSLEGTVLLKLGDDVSTDEILPSGAETLRYRSNIEKISAFAFRPLDDTYAERALAHRDGGSVIIAGRNQGQGSSREHAAAAPRYLGLRCVIAKSLRRPATPVPQ